MIESQCGATHGGFNNEITVSLATTVFRGLGPSSRQTDDVRDN